MSEDHWGKEEYRDALERSRAEVSRLTELINTPHTDDFLGSVRLEAAHQVERWGTVHDRGKEPSDWFWLVGYLAGKCLAAHIKGDLEKAKHHTISSAAALFNWWTAIAAIDTRMKPGGSDVADAR